MLLVGTQKLSLKGDRIKTVQHKIYRPTTIKNNINSIWNRCRNNHCLYLKLFFYLFVVTVCDQTAFPKILLDKKFKKLEHTACCLAYGNIALQWFKIDWLVCVRIVFQWNIHLAGILWKPLLKGIQKNIILLRFNCWTDHHTFFIHVVVDVEKNKYIFLKERNRVRIIW